MGCGVDRHTGARVFTREDGTALHPATVTDRFHATPHSVELPPIRLHDLRHGAASLMLAAGVDLKVVSETLGHSTLGLTADTYNRSIPRSPRRPPSAPPRCSRGPSSGTGVHTPFAHSTEGSRADSSAGR